MFTVFRIGRTLSMIPLSSVKQGKKCKIIAIENNLIRSRLLEMGFVPNCEVEVIRHAPLNDPIEYRVDDFFVGLRKAEASFIFVELLN